jgi:uncharacterized protein YegP (UPF0339 family)
VTARAARFEVVHADAGWHARFVAANGQTVWTTESYTRRKAAFHSVELIAAAAVYSTPHNIHDEVLWSGDMERPTEVRLVDERSKP